MTPVTTTKASASIDDRPRRFFALTNAELRLQIRGVTSDDLGLIFEYLRELSFRKRIKPRERTELRALLGRQVLEWLNRRREPDEPGFEFPTTKVEAFRRTALHDAGVDWKKEGLLSLSGYRVGLKDGVAERERRRILNYIFIKDALGDLPDPAYAREWGSPATPERLRKLANCIASFAKNAKRRTSANYSVAIASWESDLEYLRVTFYDRWGGFPWPTAELPVGW